MKTMLAIVLMFTFSQSIWANDFNISQKDCTSLATKLSMTAFAPDNNFQLNSFNKQSDTSLGPLYFDVAGKSLNRNLNKFCNEPGDISFAELSDHHEKSCSSICQRNSKTVAEKHRKLANDSCLDICKDNQDKIEMVKMGYAMNTCVTRSRTLDLRKRNERKTE